MWSWAGQQTPAHPAAPSFSRLLADDLRRVAADIVPLPAFQGCYLLVFSSAVDAVRFCHAGQALLMYSHWPAELQQDYSGPAEVTADNRLVFKGPRMAMAVHESDEYSCMVRMDGVADGRQSGYTHACHERISI